MLGINGRPSKAAAPSGKPLQVVLGEAEFAALVQGRVVEAHGADGRSVRMILADIGWSAMLRAIEEAMRTTMHTALDADRVSPGP